MTKEPGPLTLSDFFQMCRRGKRMILYGTLLGMAIAASFSLFRPVLYEAEATFFDKGLKGEHDGTPLTAMLLQGKSTKKSEAIPILESRKLMEQLIIENALQASIQRRSMPRELGSRLWQHIFASYAYLAQSEYPLVKDQQNPFNVTWVDYQEETPLKLFIILDSKETYQVHNASGKNLGTGTFGEAFSRSQFSFVLEKSATPAPGRYPLKLSPLTLTAKRYLKHLVVKSDKEIPSLIKLQYYDRDRLQTASLLNQLMALYTRYLKNHHQTLVDEQLAYLQKRQQAMGEELRTMMEEHARTLSSEFSSVGFPDAEQAMNFLAASMQECKQKLLLTKYEMSHFEPLIASHQKKGIFTGEQIRDERRGQPQMGLGEERSEEDAPCKKMIFSDGSQSGVEEQTDEKVLTRGFQGIDLATAKALIVDYNQELGKVEAATAEHTYMHKQLAKPHFEISSLSSVLNDPVSSQIIAKASELELSLHDAHNRMPAEQARIKGELDVQKQFLSLHLEQTLHLLTLRQQLLQQKIISLQHTLRDLAKQEIALLESHQKELRQEISQLPKKWVSEKLLHQQMQTNQKMVDELIKLTDSKNLARNLEVVQSSPIDLAYTPLHPRNPQLPLFLLLGALFGGSLSLFAVICRNQGY